MLDFTFLRDMDSEDLQRAAQIDTFDQETQFQIASEMIRRLDEIKTELTNI